VLSLNAQDIYGCTSPFAPNYNPAATINDYSCDYDLPQLLADGYCIQELLDGDVWYYDFQGIEYGGGYIRHVSESAGKALISSGANVGSFEWGCYTQNVSTSTSAWTGETNTLAIVSAGCADVADAAIAAYQFSQNGYNDWFLPSKGDDGLGDCGTCGAWGNNNYWSSSQYNSSEAWELTTSTFSYDRASKYYDKYVVPVRYIDLQDDCIGPASCQDWVQEGQGGPPLGVSCDYPLFNCESIDDPIWNDMATGLYPADTSYLEVGISSDASVLLHASESFTVDGTAQTLISLEIDSIADLPPGLTLDDPGLPLMLSPDEGAVSTSCFALEGVPSDQGTYTITVYSTATIAVFGFEIPVDGVQFHHTIEVLETTSEILGCTYADALNFNPYANSDDGSCEFEPFAGCESDADEDGVCDEDEVAGCTDFTACNFDDFSTDDDDSCFYEEFGYDCDGNCLFDVDEDGVCDQWEVCGCQDPLACNYDATATDEGMCDYASCYGCTDSVACNFDDFATEDDGSCGYGDCSDFGCVDPSGCNYDPDASADDGSCDYSSCQGCTDDGACNYGANFTIDNGLCDYSCLGCTDEFACNYNEAAEQDDETCIYCGETCLETTGYNLIVEVYDEDIVPGLTTYRIYQGMVNEGDFLSSVYGNEDQPFNLSTTTGFYNSQFGGTTAGAINPALFPFFSDLAGDSWVTIGIESQPSGAEAAPSTVESYNQPWVSAFAANSGISGQDISMTDATGGAWYLVNGTPNGLPDENNRVLIIQITTAGEVSGVINTQIFENGYGESPIYSTYAISGVGEFGTNGIVNACGCADPEASNYDESAQYDDGSCAYPILGCTDSAACNFNLDATMDDASCEYPAFGYNCSGDCIADSDMDGVCDTNEIAGCVDIMACNFMNEATDDDGSCSYPTSDLYDCDGSCINDLDGDSICDEDEIMGCSYPAACNFNPLTTDDDGECVFPEVGFDCDGNCLFDDDGDGICDQDEVLGCSDQTACNYTAETTEEGLCDYESCIVEGCVDEGACNYNPNANADDYSCLYIDECGVCGGTGILPGACDCAGNFPNDFYGCDGLCLLDDDADGVCDELEVVGCTDDDACNFNINATDESGDCDYCTCLPSNDDLPYTLTVEVHAEGIIEGMTTYRFYIDLVNDDDFLSSIYGNDEAPLYLTTTTGFYNDLVGSSTASSIIPALIPLFPSVAADSWITIGIDGQNVGNEVEISTIESFEQPFVAAFSSGSDIDGHDVYMDDFTGGVWYVLNGTPNGLPDENGRVLFLQLTTAESFEAQINAQIFENGIGSEDLRKTFSVDGVGTFYDNQYTICGCDDPIACNYDDSATHNDGSCIFDCLGCTNSLACNYDPLSTEDDGSCELSDSGYDCQGECLSDTDGDGVCDANEIPGCTAEDACNFYSQATDEDGSCTYPISSNHDCSGACFSDADGDTVCDEDEVYGCTYVDACTYEEEATDDDGSCEFAEDGFTCEGTCLFDEDGDGICDEDELTGCQDPAACNYSVLATDMGYCLYPDLNYNCQGNCINDEDGDGICDEVEVLGCMDISACNYSISASDEDESCIYPTPGYDCAGVGTLSGCMDESACNFDPAATIVNANSICLYPVLNYDCDGNCISDSDGDGICDAVEEFIENEIQIAIDEVNEEFIAALANGVYCGEGTIWVESWQQCVAIPSCFGDHDLDGNRGTEDLLLFLAVYGTTCPGELGCTDPSAINFDPAATENDESCDFYGCTLSTACNYNPSATLDDTSCLEWDECGVCGGEGIQENTCDCEGNGPLIGYDCSGNCLSDTDNDGVCDENEILGCMSLSASNFNSDATSDDGSCLWDSSSFIGLSYDLVSADGILGQMTVRVFADFEVGEEVVLTSVLGDSQSPWITASTGEFYQHPLGADFGGDINPGFFSLFPELEFDSWFTIGAAPGDYNALSQQNMYLHLPEFNAGDDMIINTEEGAAIYAPPASGSQGYIDENGRVLIGQFTTNGLVQLVLNITFQDYNLNTSESLTNLHLDIPFVD